MQHTGQHVAGLPDLSKPNHDKIFYPLRNIWEAVVRIGPDQGRNSSCHDIGKDAHTDYRQKKGENIVNPDQMKLKPMTEDQLQYIKKEINKTYLSLISHTTHDPKVIETMKLAALSDVQKRFETGEPW